MKKNRDEPTGVIIHIYMEISKRNSLCAATFISKSKNVTFFPIFLLQNQRTGGQHKSYDGNGKWQGKKG
jgi:hypothetical protein